MGQYISSDDFYDIYKIKAFKLPIFGTIIDERTIEYVNIPVSLTVSGTSVTTSICGDNGNTNRISFSHPLTSLDIKEKKISDTIILSVTLK